MLDCLHSLVDLVAKGVAKLLHITLFSLIPPNITCEGPIFDAVGEKVTEEILRELSYQQQNKSDESHRLTNTGYLGPADSLSRPCHDSPPYSFATTLNLSPSIARDFYYGEVLPVS